ncbi:hypothetical protein JB92DRAFT_2824538 [Gautieria morchelliformis]|nr:hypothetical protein JB92DRAFT_2824538 [Gautieria morchelliformis]
MLAWGSPYASFTLPVIGPEKVVVFGDVEAKVRMQAEATGGKLDDIIDEVNMVLFYYPSSGHLKNLAGRTTMYGFLRRWGRELLVKIVTFQQPGPGLQQNEMFTTTYRWLGETNCPVYPIGPLISPGFGDTGLSDVAKQMELACSNNGDEFKTGSKTTESNLLST